MYRWVRQRHMMGLRGRNFLEAPWAGGVVLLVCVIAAMLLANLPATKLYYHHLLETDLSLMVHSPDGVIDWIFPRGMTVEKFINDGLMVIFFFAVGLEIKREIVCGQLSSARRAILPDGVDLVLRNRGGEVHPTQKIVAGAFARMQQGIGCLRFGLDVGGNFNACLGNVQFHIFHHIAN